MERVERPFFLPPRAVNVREAEPTDAPAIAELTLQLGYPVEVEAMRDRLRVLKLRHDHLVLVATIDQAIGGWVHACAAEALESGFRVEIVGLVVAERFRRRGVGRRLMEAAEKWAVAQGAPVLVVRSNIRRTESHGFYPSLGFAVNKTQTVFHKRLPHKDTSGPAG